MKKGLKSEEGLASLRQLVAEQFGQETKVVDEKIVSPSPGYRVYWRTVLFSKSDKLWRIEWSPDGQNRVAGFYIACPNGMFRGGIICRLLLKMTLTCRTFSIPGNSATPFLLDTSR
jgi:hypothetical protein